MKRQTDLWLYMVVVAVTCGALAAGIHHVPYGFHVALFLIAAGLTVGILRQAWKCQKSYATIAWVYFLSSLLTILLITDSITHLTGL